MEDIEGANTGFVFLSLCCNEHTLWASVQGAYVKYASENHRQVKMQHLFMFNFQFLSCHNAVLVLCLDLGTKTT